MIRSITLAAFLACLVTSTRAFVTPSRTTMRSNTELSASSRRDFITAGLVAAGFGVADPAHATYSAYVARERDWEERNSQGAIQYKTARDLRAELREIVPANSEGSKIFCPNGPSAAVSPLMENKCGDLLAAPSVFGRTQDIAGNSIPGKSQNRFPASFEGESTTLSAAGGFPKY